MHDLLIFLLGMLLGGVPWVMLCMVVWQRSIRPFNFTWDDKVYEDAVRHEADLMDRDERGRRWFFWG